MYSRSLNYVQMVLKQKEDCRSGIVETYVDNRAGQYTFCRVEQITRKSIDTVAFLVVLRMCEFVLEHGRNFH